MNDVPLIKTNSINDINTSLIAIKKQLRQINEAVGLIDIPNVDASGFVKLSIFNSLLTVGFILPYGGTVRPSEYWELCLGETKNRSDYPELISWAIINEQIGSGKLLGAGNGSTTFTLPDLREVALKGAGESGRSVDAHIKSGGLTVGEFVDDRVQSHTHSTRTLGYTWGYGVNNKIPINSDGNYSLTDPYVATPPQVETFSQSSRNGATTEVKAVGINYVIKVK